MIILKYEVPIEDNFTIEIPDPFKILSFQVQNDRPYIWVQCEDINSKKDKVKFSIVGTGHEIYFHGFYIGTVQLPPFVWHLFMR
jgi:hypothetical protein